MSSLTGFKPGVYTSLTRPSVPFIGQTIFETDTGRIKTYMGTTLGWIDRWYHEASEVAATIVTAAITIPVSTGDLAGTVIAFTGLVGRLYDLVVDCWISHSSGPAATQIFLTDSANNVQDQCVDVPTSQVRSVRLQKQAFTAVGAQSYKLRGNAPNGGSISSSATSPLNMIVRDIGPAAPPVITT